MKAIIFTLLIGTILAVACASPAPTKLQSLQALLQGVQEEKVQLMDDDDDVLRRLSYISFEQQMVNMQDDDDDKLADAHIIKHVGKCLLGWWYYSKAENSLDCWLNTNNLVMENHNEHLSDLG